jgi:hypothetical protein
MDKIPEQIDQLLKKNEGMEKYLRIASKLKKVELYNFILYQASCGFLKTYENEPPNKQQMQLFTVKSYFEELRQDLMFCSISAQEIKTFDDFFNNLTKNIQEKIDDENLSKNGGPSKP